MFKRIGAILLTVLSYVLIYSGIRFLIKRFMGEDAPLARFAATLGTLAFSPRFNYENDEKGKRLEARWILLRKRQKVYDFDPPDDQLEDGDSVDQSSSEEVKDNPDTPLPNLGENGSAQ